MLCRISTDIDMIDIHLQIQSVREKIDRQFILGLSTLADQDALRDS